MNIINVKKYLNLSSDERYAEAVNATIATMNEALFNKYHCAAKNRWVDLACVWDKVHTDGKQMVLTYALHKIYWGIYPSPVDDPNMHYLLSLVEAELLDDGEAFKCWSQCAVYENILEAMMDDMCSYGKSGLEIHFIEHHHYLCARFLCKVKYSKTRPFGYDEYRREYEGYERIVTRFVSAATTWTSEGWGNDLNIASALESAYGVDYSASGESQNDYDRIVMLCRELDCWGDTNNAIWYAANIVQLPLAMAKTLWPVDLEANVTKLFLAAYKATVRYENSGQLCLDKKNKYFHPVGHFEREVLKAGWLYQNVSKWYIEGKYSGQQEKDVKTALFDLEMTC